MAIDSDYYIHDSDRAALKALKAIPGFHQLMKSFMKVFSERQFRVANMSSCVRINENQLSKYYDMLPPICEKLGIAIPELYLELNVTPNSYTSGDTNPFVIITSGLLETLPDELIPTVLAHECGHIACHHVLYSTIGGLLLGTTKNALTSYVPFGDLISIPIEIAFFYWMRCSEYSADRAAVLCDGTAEKMSEVCMRLAGFDKDIKIKANKDEFMKQAQEYRDMINNSKWDKTLEFLILREKSHPLLTVRALECEEWAKSDQYQNIKNGAYHLENHNDDFGDKKKTDNEESETVEPKKRKARLGISKFSIPFIKKSEDTETVTGKSDDIGELNATDSSTPDEIRKYKELLDEGIITEEEFIAKKSN